MALRHYVCGIIGDGLTPETAFRPVVRELVPGVGFSAVDGGDWMLVSTDVTDTEHATLVADPRITALPLPLDLDAPIGDADLRTQLEALHVPAHDLTPQSTVREVLRRICRRLIIRQVLGADDFTEGLDTVADLSARRSRLEPLGFDLSVIVLGDTVGQALVKLHAQPARWNRTHLDPTGR